MVTDADWGAALPHSRSGAPRAGHHRAGAGSLLVLGVSAIALGCSPATPPATTEHVPDQGCTVHVAAAGEGFLLEVALHCPKARLSVVAAEPPLVRHIQGLQSWAGEKPEWDRNEALFEQPSEGVRYRVDLGRMAAEERDFNSALRVGDSLIAPGYSWLVSPTEVPEAAAIRVQPAASLSNRGFAFGPERVRHGYLLRASEVSVSTFAVFGQFQQTALSTARLDGSAATIEVMFLDGPIAAPRPTLIRWVEETVAAVSKFYRGFPSRRALIFMVPVPERRGVVHGKVLPESSPGIALLVGEYSGKPELYRDWILTHELIHLGFPSFVDEGKWLDEGLATYFEPIIRYRQGWLSEEELWADFYDNMPRGRLLFERDGLNQARSFGSIYWGGATLCLLADIRARTQGNGGGLEAAMRAVLRAGGDASRVWSLRRAIGVMDQAMGTAALETLVARYQEPSAAPDLRALFAELGVVRTSEGVHFVDGPLAAVRRAISGSPAETSVGPR